MVHVLSYTSELHNASCLVNSLKCYWSFAFSVPQSTVPRVQHSPPERMLDSRKVSNKAVHAVRFDFYAPLATTHLGGFRAENCTRLPRKVYGEIVRSGISKITVHTWIKVLFSMLKRPLGLNVSRDRYPEQRAVFQKQRGHVGHMLKVEFGTEIDRQCFIARKLIHSRRMKSTLLYIYLNIYIVNGNSLNSDHILC